MSAEDAMMIDSEPSSDELVARDAQTRVNLKHKTKKMDANIPRPTVRTLYMNPESYMITSVPADLQLPVYLAAYNHLFARSLTASFHFSLNPDVHKINRLIWFYGLDEFHSFSRRYAQIRWNILLMAFAWASGSSTVTGQSVGMQVLGDVMSSVQAAGSSKQ